MQSPLQVKPPISLENPQITDVSWKRILAAKARVAAKRARKVTHKNLVWKFPTFQKLFEILQNKTLHRGDSMVDQQNLNKRSSTILGRD